MTTNTDVGPRIGPEVTNFLGTGISTDVVVRADLNAYYKIWQFSLTVFVDQPGKGGDESPIDQEVYLDALQRPQKRDDWGHAFWKFDCSDSNSIPVELRPFRGQYMGFYPTVQITNLAHTPSGFVKMPDTSHLEKVNVTKVFHLSQSAFTSGLYRARAIYNSPGAYSVSNNNCVHAFLDVTDASGIPIPRTKSTKYKQFNGLNCGDLGQDLRRSYP